MRVVRDRKKTHLGKHLARSKVSDQRIVISRGYTSPDTHRNLDGTLTILDFCHYSPKQGSRVDDLDISKLELLGLL